MSEPASSRTSMDHPPAGPVPLFDTHLKLLSDSYLSLFIERKRIEEVYVESLTRLHRKIQSLDTFIDDRNDDLSTTRSAWSEVRENVEREAQARQAFLATLTADVINPLTNLKETQERTRKRIKEDLKESGLAYNDYAEVTLPKLKSRYLRKFQEVEDAKKAATSNTSAPSNPATTAPDYQGLGTPRSPTSSRPNVTSPQPLRALDRRPSGSAPSGRNRSPSSGTAFSDLAKEGKKQLNQLMGLLDNRGSVRDNSRGENHALRTVRAKRELDEADKEYRKGVHWLETLRLRRIRTLESGYNSLLTFVEECSSTVKQTLEKYTDNLTATNATLTGLASHARTVVGKISPQRDKAKFEAFVPRSLASAIPDPILYQNCIVGECLDLVFGFSLTDYATSRNLPEGEVPKIVRICIAEIDKRGLETEGIYRVSGRHAIVQTLQHEYEKDEDAFKFSSKDDIYAVASLLKLYLRELPEPVFRFSLQERIQHSQGFAEHQSNNFVLLRSKMRRVPAVHQATLKALVEHLARVAARSEKNKMDPKNLAIVFGQVIFGDDEIPKAGDLLSVQNFKDSVMEDLITNAQVLFSDEPIQSNNQRNNTSSSPPLPPMPAGDPEPQYYGSKTTRIANVPPSPITVSPITLSEDFNPALPARPANSIHPSARSPTKERMEITPPLPVRPSQRKRDEAQPQHPPPSPSFTTSTVSLLETDESEMHESADDHDNEPPPAAQVSSSAPTSPHKRDVSDTKRRSVQNMEPPPSPRTDK